MKVVRTLSKPSYRYLLSVLPVSPTVCVRPIMIILFQYCEDGLPGRSLFLMLKLAFADDSAGKVAKARSIARVESISKPARSPGPSAVRGRRSQRGLAAHRECSRAAAIRRPAALGASRQGSSSPHQKTRQSLRGVPSGAFQAGNGYAFRIRQNGRCRKSFPSRWGENWKGHEARQEAGSWPDRFGDSVRSLQERRSYERFGQSSEVVFR